jgi:hypothetical protein
MKMKFSKNLTVLLHSVFLFNFCLSISAQNPSEFKTKSIFWEKVQFGGGLGLGFGSGYTDIMVAPNAIYNFNQYVAAGVGLQYSYSQQKDYFKSNIYGASILGLFNPIEEIQLSVEVEQLRVNAIFEDFYNHYEDNFWNTALFLGAGYRSNNVTFGLRYNVLFKDNQGVYADALMPFVRIYF